MYPVGTLLKSRYGEIVEVIKFHNESFFFKILFNCLGHRFYDKFVQVPVLFNSGDWRELSSLERELL